MRMVLAGLQFEKIHHVDETNLYVGELFPQQHCRGQRLLGRYVAGGGHHDIGFDTLVVTGPVPNTDALGAMLDSRIHIQVLQVQLLV